MKILSIRPCPPGGRYIARFDAELPLGIKAYDLKMVRGPSGIRVYGPQFASGAAVTFPPAVADELAKLAMEAVAPYANQP